MLVLEGAQAALSYDLTLFQVPDGADAESVYEELMQQEELEAADLDQALQKPLTESVRSRMRQLADALRMRCSTLTLFQPEPSSSWIELNDEKLQVQITISEQKVNITMPYFREGGKEMMDLVKDSLEVVHATSGYLAYDPQLGRIVTSADIEEMARQYRSMDRVLPFIRAENRLHFPGKKPWWEVW